MMCSTRSFGNFVSGEPNSRPFAHSADQEHGKQRAQKQQEDQKQKPTKLGTDGCGGTEDQDSGHRISENHRPGQRANMALTNPRFLPQETRMSRKALMPNPIPKNGESTLRPANNSIRR